MSSIAAMAAKGRDDKLRAALEKDETRVNERNSRGQTPLHAAVDAGEEEAVGVLLEFGADTAAEDRDGLTPLLLAAAVGAEGIAMVLAAAKGEKLRGRDGAGQNLAHLAVRHGMGALLDLVARRAPAAFKEKEEASGFTPVLMGAAVGSSDLVADLLGARGRLASDAVKADRDAAGNSCVHWAARRGDHEAIRTYCGAGADPNAANQAGQTPMHVAYETFRSNAGGLVRVLQEFGGDPEARDAAGQRPADVLAALEREAEAERAEAAAADQDRRSRAKFRKAARQACDPAVAAWLGEHGLAHLEDAFGRRGVSEAEIADLTPASLGKMGVPVEERPRVMDAVAEVRRRAEEARLEAERAVLRELQAQQAQAGRTRLIIAAVVVAFFVAVFFFFRWVEERGTPVRLGGQSYSDEQYRRHEEGQ